MRSSCNAKDAQAHPCTSNAVLQECKYYWPQKQFSVFKYIIISLSSKYMWAQKKNGNRVDEQTINNLLYTYWHLRHTYRPVSGENNFFFHFISKL